MSLDAGNVSMTQEGQGGSGNKKMERGEAELQKDMSKLKNDVTEEQVNIDKLLQLPKETVKEAPKELVLYYFPTSYSSRKILLCMFEKKIKFKRIIVSLFHRQDMEPWYMRLNPHGVHVPVLVHGNRIITDPDKIIAYIDTVEGISQPQLIPCHPPLLEENVTKFLEELEKIPMNVITYGIVFHDSLSASGCQLAVAIQRSMRENFTNRLQHLVTLSTQYPDLRDCYLTKSQTAAEQYDLINDESTVKYHIDQLSPFLQRVEESLLQKYTQQSDLHELNEMYLFGDNVTAADIGLYVLITRLQILGLLIPMSERRPYTFHHFTLMSNRLSVTELTKEIGKMKYTLYLEDFKAASPYLCVALGASLVLVAGTYFIKKLGKS